MRLPSLFPLCRRCSIRSRTEYRSLGWCIVVFCRWGDEELSFIAHDNCGVSVGHEIHNGVLYYGVWEGVVSDVSPSGVTLKKLYVGDEDAVSAPAGEYLVCVWHVDERSALGVVLVADVESDVVLDVEFPCAFVVLERREA